MIKAESIRYDAARKSLESIDKQTLDKYIEYWKWPDNKLSDDQLISNYVLVMLTPIANWTQTIKAYDQIFDNQEAIVDEKSLTKILFESGIGCQKKRASYICGGLQKLKKDLSIIKYKPEDSYYTVTRDRIADEFKGLGLAKSSFLMELNYPLEAKVLCMDTHLLQLYGLPKSISNRLYANAEEHWLASCKELKLPPPIARHIVWDRIHNQDDTSYWAYTIKGARLLSLEKLQLKDSKQVDILASIPEVRVELPILM